MTARRHSESLRTAPTTMGLTTHSTYLVECPDAELENTAGELYGQKLSKFDHMFLTVWPTGKQLVCCRQN